MPSLLLFGASGAIGSALHARFTAAGWNVTGTGRTKGGAVKAPYDPLHDADASVLDAFAPFDAVAYAQGANCNDSIYDVDTARHRAIYDANCLSILISLQQLLARNLLARPARICVISSIWQEQARQNKLSYGMSKAALKGLVLSAAADLAKDGHLINAVLPGVLDTPMTRANLTPEQVAVFEHGTQFHRLPGLEDVVYAAEVLVSPENKSITGQFVKVDLGFSDVRIV